MKAQQKERGEVDEGGKKDRRGGREEGGMLSRLFQKHSLCLSEALIWFIFLIVTAVRMLKKLGSSTKALLV